METRLLVERFALDKVLAGGEPAPELVAALMAAIERQEELAVAGDSEGFVAEDRDFHTIFVNAAGNPIIAGLYDSLRDRQRRMIITSLLRDERRTAMILVEHRAIVGAIAAGDRARAQEVLTTHLRGTLELLHRSP
jgi:DNA-binding GntR family transcriptional regulator